jgi:hypothetical protein
VKYHVHTYIAAFHIPHRNTLWYTMCIHTLQLFIFHTETCCDIPYADIHCSFPYSTQKHVVIYHVQTYIAAFLIPHRNTDTIPSHIPKDWQWLYQNSRRAFHKVCLHAPKCAYPTLVEQLGEIQREIISCTLSLWLVIQLFSDRN